MQWLDGAIVGVCVHHETQGHCCKERAAARGMGFG